MTILFIVKNQSTPALILKRPQPLRIKINAEVVWFRQGKCPKLCRVLSPLKAVVIRLEEVSKCLVPLKQSLVLICFLWFYFSLLFYLVFPQSLCWCHSKIVLIPLRGLFSIFILLLLDTRPYHRCKLSPGNSLTQGLKAWPCFLWSQSVPSRILLCSEFSAFTEGESAFLCFFLS